MPGGHRSHLLWLSQFFAVVLVALGAGCSSAPELSPPTVEMPATFEAGGRQDGRQEIELPLADPSATRGGGSVQPPRGGAREPFDIVTVFWGTNRRLPEGVDRKTPAQASSENGRQLALGFAHVTIPKVGRDVGSLQRPPRFAMLGTTLFVGSEDPKQHFTIGDFKRLDLGMFVSATETTRKLSQRYRDEALVFIHGYNTPFDGAIFRTAQLAYDLEFDGVPYVFSWPSLGSPDGYIHDKDASDAARRYLKEFLDIVVTRTGARRVHLIAHSMGSRLLTEVLRSMPPPPDGRPRFEQLILAAPDIDADVFREIAAQVRPVGRAMTIYASKNDRALWLSRSAAIGRPRVGEITPNGPILVDGVDAIDISGADFSTLWGLNHSTFAERSPVLNDLKLLIAKGTRPPETRTGTLQRIEVASRGVYWKYVPTKQAASR